MPSVPVNAEPPALIASTVLCILNGTRVPGPMGSPDKSRTTRTTCTYGWPATNAGDVVSVTDFRAASTTGELTVRPAME